MDARRGEALAVSGLTDLDASPSVLEPGYIVSIVHTFLDERVLRQRATAQARGRRAIAHQTTAQAH